MIRHVVLLKLKEETTSEHVQAIAAALAELPSKIPQIQKYVFGKDLAVSDTTSDFGIIADFEDLESYKAYSTHPAHVEAVVNVIKPHVTQKNHLQFEL